MAGILNISQMATAVMHWLSYHSAIGRNYVLSESALKFPVSEYLERSKLEKIELEYSHPRLFKKRFDLCYQDQDKKDVAFEFKYIKNGSTRNTDEKQRIFDDLMRLYLYVEGDKRGYFLICGDQFQFTSSFEKAISKPIKDSDKFIEPRIKPKSSDKEEPQGFYTEWFSFNPSMPAKTIDLKVSMGVHRPFYDGFMTDYSNAFERKSKSELKLPDSFITKLIFLSDMFNGTQAMFQPSRIGIWEVLKA